jgi:hypothetical protein
VGNFVRAAVVIALLFAASASFACGDKLTAFSRGANYRNGTHAAQILLFAPNGSAAASLAADAQFQAALKKGNHKLRVADSADNFASALASGTFDLVVAAPDSGPKVEEQLRSHSSSALFVPVIETPSKVELREMEHRYPVVLTSHAKAGRYLDSLDDAIEFRLQRSQPTRMARK